MLSIFYPTYDTYLWESSPDSPRDTLTEIYVNKNISGGRYRPVLKFDFSSISSQEIISATLDLYCIYVAAAAIGRSFSANELTQIGGIAGEMCWNNYKSGFAWSSAGGDFTATNSAITIPPTVNNWMTWTVTDLIKHFQTDHGSIANFLMKDSDESTGDAVLGFDSLEYVDDVSLRPKLTITYGKIFAPYVAIF